MNAPPFIDTAFINHIKVDAIKSLYPAFNDTDTDILANYIIKLVNLFNHTIYNHYYVTDPQLLRTQYKLNNYLDLKMMCNMLLPYINPVNATKLSSFNALYHEKDIDVDINITAPRYRFSNIQYNRNRIDNNHITELPYDVSHIDQNYKLLVMTIYNMHYKLHVNWVNVWPVLGGYTQSSLYQRTTQWWHSDISYDAPNYDIDDYSQYTHLNIDQLYDAIVGIWYYPILPNKYLIYTVKRRNGDYMILYDLLKQLNIINETQYIDNYDAARQSAYQTWSRLVSLYNDERDDSITGIDAITLKHVITAIILYFNNHYENIDKLSQYKPITGITNDDLDNDKIDNLELQKHTTAQIHNAIQSTTHATVFAALFDYIIYSYAQIKKTAMYCDNPNDANFYTLPYRKVFYNFAKSLCHYGDDFKLLPKTWAACTDAHRAIISSRLRDKTNSLQWFNISNFIRRFIGGIHTNESIYAMIYNIIPDIACYGLWRVGLLSECKIMPKLTDTSLAGSIPMDKYIIIQLRKLFTDNNNQILNQANNCYYYINGSKYGDIRYYGDEEHKQTILPMLNHIMNITAAPWINMFAQYWATQVMFFHKYMHNRVIFVTGGTGTGKSTQIPKLLYYALKACDYNFVGRVVCTQPRTQPATKSAARVGGEMGIPITDNNRGTVFNMQYVTQKDKYPDAKTIVPTYLKTTNFLMFVTDGTLEIKITNPLLHDEYDNGKLGENNMYDIVVVDESHEHNKNMDLILSYMRNIAYLNNTIKLVIVSATMDNDEPTYRRYYRMINDNRKYPLCQDLAKYNLDRINIDRRLDISIPQQTTRFVINEIYRPLSLDTPDDVLYDTVIKSVRDIVTRSSTGDILIFMPGLKEIGAIIDLLKLANLPQNIYFLPFYSDLDDDDSTDEKRKIIENIDKQEVRNSIKLDRDIDFNQSTKEQRAQGQRTYDRFIIVATTIAEASITINTLKYVIETGTQKLLFYNYKSRIGQIRKINISESARLQRKGRVGRTSSGEVVYMYPRDSLVNNRQQYNISISDVSFDIIKKMTSQASYMISQQNDPNNINNRETTNMTYNGDDITKFINDHYYVDNKLYDYWGQPTQEQYEPNHLIYDIFKDGYDMTTLIDNRCMFYIIHPDETIINRNIRGVVTSICESCRGAVSYNNNMIESRKMMAFIDTLVDSFMLSQHNDTYVKTDYGQKYNDVVPLFTTLATPELFRFFMHMYSYNLTSADKLDPILLFSILTTFKQINRDIPRYAQMSYDTMSDIMMIYDKLNNTHVMMLVRKYLNNDASQELKHIDYASYGRQLGINDRIIKTLIRQYIYLFHELANVLQHSRDTMKLTNLTSIINQMNDVATLSSYNRMALALLQSTPYNLFKLIGKFNNRDYYIRIYDPQVDNIYTFTYEQKSLRPIHMLNHTYTSNIVHAFVLNAEENTMALISYIPQELLRYIPHIYNHAKLNDVYTTCMNTHFDTKSDIAKDLSRMLSKYRKTIHEMINIVATNDVIVDRHLSKMRELDRNVKIYMHHTTIRPMAMAGGSTMKQLSYTYIAPNKLNPHILANFYHDK